MDGARRGRGRRFINTGRQDLASLRVDLTGERGKMRSGGDDERKIPE
jgi:hypothetical protein